VLTRGEPESPDERRWDPAAVSAAPLEGAEAVVHLAGATIASRWTATRRREIRASRVGSARALVDSIARLTRAPRVVVSASAVGIYGDRGDEWLTEDSASGRGFLADLALEWEAEIGRARKFGARVACLRFGIVLARGGGALAPLVPLFRLGLGGAPGSGRQWWSWIAIADAVRIVMRALDDGAMEGPVNAVSPTPVTAREFARALGRTLHRPALVPAPAPILRLAFGAMADEVLLASQRARPARLAALGFEFRHPRLDGALAAILLGARES